MMVGAILEVMSQEHRNAREELADDETLPATKGQINELKTQISELNSLLTKSIMSFLLKVQKIIKINKYNLVLNI